MDALIRFGFSIEEIKNMMDSNPLIDNVKDHDIQNIIDILIDVGASTNIIKNILISNPFLLNRDKDKISNIINEFKKMKISNISNLLDHNPFLLNKEIEEISILDKNNIDKLFEEMII